MLTNIQTTNVRWPVLKDKIPRKTKSILFLSYGNYNPKIYNPCPLALQNKGRERIAQYLLLLWSYTFYQTSSFFYLSTGRSGKRNTKYLLKRKKYAAEIR